MADLRESNQLSFEQEINHWWIKTRFLYVNKILNLLAGPSKLIEYGCGTGQNLFYATTLAKNKHLIQSAIGIDPNLKSSVKKNWGTLEVEICQDPPAATNFDCLLAMDVLEHIENDKDALSTWTKQLRPGGHILITVPAFQSLWSYQDIFLGHKRRYTRKEIKQLANSLNLEILYCRYAFSWAFPLVFLVRKIINRNKKIDEADLKPTNPILNRIFYFIGLVEYWIGGDFFIGTSVVAILKKPNN